MINHEVRVSRLKAINDRLYSEIFQPIGSERLTRNVYGAHLWDNCEKNALFTCPLIQEDWFILVDKEEERKGEDPTRQEIRDALIRNGHSIRHDSGAIGASKDNVYILLKLT